METADQTTAAAAPAATEIPSLVIFGMDDQRKPHASAFVASEVELAQKASALMGMAIFHPKSEEEHSLVAQLPRGRIFASGKAFVPFVAAANYKRLCELAGVPATLPPEPAEIQCPASPSPDNAVVASAADAARGEPRSDDETNLAAGAVVLACERDGGFYEAIIVRIDGEVLSLRWEGWPKLPIFTRRRGQVAPLPDRKPYW